ncbi:hypothetical protein [Haliea sp. E17]|uniref:hypothetical protein n=1 Tax=Haliea sp. E17 TaxID=3401576 RepID=UPI003AAF5414
MPLKRRTFLNNLGTTTLAGGLPLSLSAPLFAKAPTYSDLSGGLAPEKDYALFEKPDNPEMREGVSMWMFEDSGAFGFPRMGIEVVAGRWGDNRFNCNFALPQGRVLTGAGYGAVPTPIDAQGKPTIIGAGPVTFQCLEPFKRWKIVYEGSALDGTVEQQISGAFNKGEKQTPVRLEAEMTMVTPAWVQEFSADTDKMSKEEAENAEAMGLGYRYEHHFRATGTLSIDGGSRDFSATGLRIHRQSIRRLEGFYGHCWLSALFPDDSAFGMLVYPPAQGSDEYSYNDAVIYRNGRQYPARVIKAPLLSDTVPEGELLEIELESELGTHRISGRTTLSTFKANQPELQGLVLQQAGALYTWGDQQAYGMVERSYNPEKDGHR